MVLDPKVLQQQKEYSSSDLAMKIKITPTHDTTAKERPRVGTRVKSVSIRQSCIRSPHNMLKLPKLGEETREPVIDLLSISRH
jgi:hypothetical protein